jgi:hypothetical protein
MDKLTMSISLDAANALPDRSDELFRIFARFEFALKMAGFCKMRNNAVVLDWDCFANSNQIGKKFFDHVCEAEVCPTLIGSPPKSETIADGAWGFNCVVAKPTSPQELFGALRRVRNNLFHGGKYFDDDNDRNEKLVSDAISVLLLAAECHTDVGCYFEGRV